jgi:hypothetical protein
MPSSSHASVTATSMLPRGAFEYGQFLCASSTKLWATSRARLGRLTVNHARRDELPSADWNDLGLPGIDAKVAFSPQSATNAKLGGIADDIRRTGRRRCSTRSHSCTKRSASCSMPSRPSPPTTIFLSTAFQTESRWTEGAGPSRNVAPEALSANVPEPFKSEPKGGGGH